MNHWHKGKIVQLDKIEKKNFVQKDVKAEYLSQRYIGYEQGYNETSIRISVGKDSSLFFSNENTIEGSIYIYPEQVKHLIGILKRHFPKETK
ncbi:MAG: hypothetical protein PHS34_09035 [Candidatus Omnitrophica bacterium]|nr:hypothetical protein [Candidatus Omnitrophota bacterium]